MELDDDKLRNVFASLLAAIDERDQKRFEALAEEPTIQQALEQVRRSDVTGFNHTLLQPLGSLIDGLLSRELPNNQNARFLFKHGHLVAMHLRNLYERYEGSSCCMDKARGVIRKLSDFFISGKEISFNDEGPYRFHVPTTILRTHKDIVAFFEALQSLTHGRPEPYLQALLAVDATHQVATQTPSHPQPDAN
jgi:hypothetical protein